MLTNEDIKALDWEKTSGLIPAIVQDACSGRVLMLGCMNPEALEKTLETKKVTFWSRTKGRLWTKGETSSNSPCGVSATALRRRTKSGTPSCFSPVEHKWNFLRDLEVLLESRRNADPATSYTASLYARGTKRIAQKVGEEGVETALAATVHDREELRNEAADLVYHLLVLLADADLELADVIDVLRARHASREKAAEAK